MNRSGDEQDIFSAANDRRARAVGNSSVGTWPMIGSGRPWIRAFYQPTTFVSIGVVILCILATSYLVNKDRSDAELEARRNAQNFVHGFAQSVSHALKGADSGLLLLRHAIQRDPSGVNDLVQVVGAELRKELNFQFVVVDATGILKASSHSQTPLGSVVSNGESYKAHVDATDDRLFISDPVTLRSTGKLGLILSRRLTRPDGAFDGIVAGWVELQDFETLYEALDLGPDGFASLANFNGVILARGGNGRSRWDIIGKRFPNLSVLRRVNVSPTGSYWNGASGVESVEPVKRLLAYRAVEGFPLVATVGISDATIFRYASQNARIYYGISVTIAIVIAIVVVFAARRQWNLDSIALSLSRANGNFGAALANMPHGLSMFDRNQRLIICNQAYSDMYGFPAELVRPGIHVNTLLEYRSANGGAAENIKGDIPDHLKGELQGERSSFMEELADGRVLSVSSRPMRDGGWVSIHEDVTARKHAEAKIRHLALRDALSGLANRALFTEELEKAAARCRGHNERFAVHVVDLDRFKEVNDSLGHPVGDALLKEAARRLLACARETDTVARLGGDEFAILQIVENDPRESAIVMASRILESIGAPYVLGGQKVTVDASIGISLAPDHGDKAELLLKNADLALYKVKAEGRNGFCFFEPELETAAKARRALEIDLRDAVSEEKFEVHFQPMIDTASRETVGMEALVRWRHRQRGLVLPAEFISLAEETGLIVSLGEWVLRKACAEAAHWPAGIKLAVNLSPVQFKKGNLVEVVAGALADSGFAPERLELEITESVLLHENEENLAVLHQLRALGAAIVLDDFGTGYSSLSYLRMFPFDKIKIDRSFVKEILTRADCAAIVCAVVGMAKSLDIVTTAEGIETEEQFDLLRAAGCTQAQGYLFSRPVPASELRFAPAGKRREEANVA